MADSNADMTGKSDAQVRQQSAISSRGQQQELNEKTDAQVRQQSAASNLGERRKLEEENCYEATAFAFDNWKKWLILTAVFYCQISMNFNAAIYANGVPGMAEDFGETENTIRLGQMAFLLAYAFGCELWAPWSEELGRFWVLQASLFLVNVFQLPCMFATRFPTVLAARILGGLSSAGGSVTLGIVADMFEPMDQQYAVLYISYASCAGSVIAPIAGGFVEAYLPWQWVFYLQLILGVVAQTAHYFIVPETRSSVMLDKTARRRRKAAIAQKAGSQPSDMTLFGPNEFKGNFLERTDFKECRDLMWRPYHFLLTEPIVAFLSLLSGFSDALIFTGLNSFGMVLTLWGFGPVPTGLSFFSLLLGYTLGAVFFIPFFRRNTKAIERGNGQLSAIKPEARLLPLLFTSVLLPLGFLGFGFSALGPPLVPHWIIPQVFIVLIGIANLAIYVATIDYMVAAYGAYCASATGGNGFCRDFLAGIAALYVNPLYSNIMPGTKWQLVIPTLILCLPAILLVIPVFIFWKWGEWFRKRSKFAESIAKEREEKKPARDEAIIKSRDVSRMGTALNSPVGSRRPSLDLGLLDQVLERGVLGRHATVQL
nr:hypothetical protein B0A51_15721 [Rachicladosporium sp. CCFEE 5018]